MTCNNTSVHAGISRSPPRVIPVKVSDTFYFPNNAEGDSHVGDTHNPAHVFDAWGHAEN